MEHRSKTIEELLEVQIVEKIYDLDREEQLDKSFTERRLMREYYWMIMLFTVYPFGRNDKVKGTGSVWSNEDADIWFHHHQAYRSIRVLVPRTRKGKARHVMSGESRDTVNNFFEELGMLQISAKLVVVTYFSLNLDKSLISLLVMIVLSIYLNQ